MEVDEYGTQQPIALLKLLLEKGYLYDRGKELNCKSIRDLGFAAAMGKAGGGRNEVDPRFMSLFSVFHVPFPSEASLHLIYSSILRGHTSVTRVNQQLGGNVRGASLRTRRRGHRASRRPCWGCELVLVSFKPGGKTMSGTLTELRSPSDQGSPKE